jgi:hypothetical protein
MRNPRLINHALAALVIVTGLILLAGCSVNVKKDEANGKDKKVDIETPFGGIHVSNDVDPADTGLAVYHGARRKAETNDGEEKSANVNISTSKFGLKVVAVEFQSDDSPDKLISFYKDQLKKYGDVLECHTSHHVHEEVNIHHGGNDKHEPNRPVSCDNNDSNGKVVELKVGTEDNEHMVSIEPDGKGSNFALVYVRTRGDETI